MRRPRKALVLAAGYGKRLQPLTQVRPKPLLPVWNKPVLERTLEQLRSWGVAEVVINAHHHADQIFSHLLAHPPAGLRCSLSYEPEILGTGGALAKARWFIGNEPFWMINADIVTDLPCNPLVEMHSRTGALATLWLTPDAGPRTVECRDGVITSFRCKRPGAQDTATFCGLQLLSPGIVSYLGSGAFSSIIEAYEEAMRRGHRISGCIIPGAFWADIGEPASYLAAHREMLRRPCWRIRGQHPDRWAACGKHAQIAAGAQVVNSVVWDHAVIGPRAVVDSAIVADQTLVTGPAEHMALPAEAMADPVLDRVLRTLGWARRTTSVLPLRPRGSARSFTRLVNNGSSLECAGPQSVILVRYSLERPENALYAGHTRFLTRHGVAVPRVLVNWPSERVTVFEDAGTCSLEQLVHALEPSKVEPLYQKAIDVVVNLHTRATQGARHTRLRLSIPFTQALYEWEQNLFCEQFLMRHVRPEAEDMELIRAEMARLIPPLTQAPKVLIHRDLQSSNILIRSGRAILIDYQGMRHGAAAYDLASLLCDPYVCLAGELRDRLLHYYRARIPEGGMTDSLFWCAAVERLAQALGAFGRLGSNPDTAYFLKHIPPAVRQLQVALSKTGTLPTLERCLHRCQECQPAQE